MYTLFLLRKLACISSFLERNLHTDFNILKTCYSKSDTELTKVILNYSVSLQNPHTINNINNLFNQSTCNQIQLHHSINSTSDIITQTRSTWIYHCQKAEIQQHWFGWLDIYEQKPFLYISNFEEMNPHVYATSSRLTSV